MKMNPIARILLVSLSFTPIFSYAHSTFVKNVFCPSSDLIKQNAASLTIAYKWSDNEGAGYTVKSGYEKTFEDSGLQWDITLYDVQSASDVEAKTKAQEELNHIVSLESESEKAYSIFENSYYCSYYTEDATQITLSAWDIK